MTGWGLAMEGGMATTASSRSDDGGATWRRDRMGYLGSQIGEYIVRMRLAEGEDPSPPMPILEDPTHPRVARLRDRIPAGIRAEATPLERIRALSTWLSTAFDHVDSSRAALYTAWDAETIIDWGSSGIGHDGRKPITMCVHYGVAFVSCCQALGIPARCAVFANEINSFDGHFAAEAWLEDRGKWIFVDPNTDLTFMRDGEPLSIAEVQDEGDDLRPLARWGPGADHQRRFPHMASFMDEAMMTGRFIRRRAVWSRSDLVSHPEQSPPGHGSTAYCESDLVWDERSRPALGMFRYFGGPAFFDARPIRWGSAMKIERIEVHAIRAPRLEPVNSGNIFGSLQASEFGIIRILTDDGCEGLGEISITYPRIGFSLCHAVRHLVAPALIGLDPLAAPQVLYQVDHLLAGELSAPYIRAAIEMALLDIAGRTYGVPVYQLLGGKARDSVPLAWGIYRNPPEQMADDARRAIAAGFQAIKLKVGRDLADDLAAVRAVVAEIGRSTPLRLDANTAWRSVPIAARAMRTLADECTVAWFEQPLAGRDLAGMRLLRQQTGLPVMADESVQTLPDAFAVAVAEAADVFNVYVAEAGGIRAAAAIFDLAAALHIPCIIGSQAEMGIGTAAAAHLGVAVADLPYPCETFGPLRYVNDVVENGPRIENGRLYPSDDPGLGVRLDPVALASMSVEF